MAGNKTDLTDGYIELNLIKIEEIEKKSFTIKNSLISIVKKLQEIRNNLYILFKDEKDKSDNQKTIDLSQESYIKIPDGIFGYLFEDLKLKNIKGYVEKLNSTVVICKESEKLSKKALDSFFTFGPEVANYLGKYVRYLEIPSKSIDQVFSKTILIKTPTKVSDFTAENVSKLRLLWESYKEEKSKLEKVSLQIRDICKDISKLKTQVPQVIEAKTTKDISGVKPPMPLVPSNAPNNAKNQSKESQEKSQKEEPVKKAPTIQKELSQKEEPVKKAPTIQKELWGVKFATPAGDKAWYLALLPAMRSTLPLQGGTDTPGALPGLAFKVNSNIAKHKLVGFQPVYQHLGIDSIQCTMVGAFSGGDGTAPRNAGFTAEQLERTAGGSQAAVLNQAITDLDSYRDFQSFVNFAFRDSKVLEVEINVGRNNDSSKSSGEEGFLRDSTTGNPKFQGIVRSMDLYHARKDRSWYIINIEIVDLGMLSKECVNLTTDIETAIGALPAESVRGTDSSNSDASNNSFSDNTECENSVLIKCHSFKRDNFDNSDKVENKQYTTFLEFCYNKKDGKGKYREKSQAGCLYRSETYEPKETALILLTNGATLEAHKNSSLRTIEYLENSNIELERTVEPPSLTSNPTLPIERLIGKQNGNDYYILEGGVGWSISRRNSQEVHWYEPREILKVIRHQWSVRREVQKELKMFIDSINIKMKEEVSTNTNPSTPSVTGSK